MKSPGCVKNEMRFSSVELAELASNRLKEFMNLLTSEILEKFKTNVAAPTGIFTCLKSLATEIPLPELQLIIYVGENQPVKKNRVVQTFVPSLGYSTVYRKLNKLIQCSIIVEKEGKLNLAEKYAALSLLAQLQHI